jgi:drug/metabolite transporter (DMT)-like permease
MQPPSQKRRINYKLGSIYAVVTALLLSVQEPFSFLAAKRLSLTQFVFLTQVALVMSIPLLIVHEKSRRDLVLLLGSVANYYKFGILFLIGMAGLLLFKLGLSNAHPIIISAIINLQPFFAALVALLIARVPIPVSPAIFFGCLISAFLGAMAIAWSQVGGQPAGLEPIGRERNAWHLALRRSGADLLGVGGTACL